jgi:hypothetical protein
MTCTTETITISNMGFRLILLDQELRNNQEQKKRLNLRRMQLQREIDELDLQSLQCGKSIIGLEAAIGELRMIPEYQVIYGHGAK